MPELTTVDLGRDGAVVRLLGDPHTLTAVAVAAAPWITPTRPGDHPPTAWTIHTSTTTAPPNARLIPQAVVHHDHSEPPARFLLDADRHLIIVTGEPGPEQEHTLVRLVRALIRRRLAASGDWYLHASAVEIDGRTVAFPGASRSGKTTSALALLALGGPTICLVANDDLSLRWDGRQLLALGWPRRIAVRADTLSDLRHAFPLLAGRLPAVADDDALVFRPAALAELLDRRVAAATMIDAFVFPTFTTDRAAAHELLPLDEQHAAAALAPHVQPPDLDHPWLDQVTPAPPGSPAPMAQLLTRLLPAYTLRQSASSLRDAAYAVAALLTALPPRRPHAAEILPEVAP